MQPSPQEMAQVFRLWAGIALGGPLINQMDAPRPDGQWHRHCGSRLEEIARHEASHTILGLLAGFPIERVTVEPQGYLLGAAVFRSLEDAGPEERLATLAATPRSISETREALRNFIKALRLENPLIGFREARQAWRQFCAEVEGLLVQQHTKINLLANELVHRRTLSAGEIERLLGAI